MLHRPATLILVAACCWAAAACAAMQHRSQPLKPQDRYYLPLDADPSIELCVEVRPNQWACPNFDALRKWLQLQRAA